MLSHLADQVVAVLLGHPDVADQHVRPEASEEAQGLVGGLGGLHVGPAVAQDLPHQGPGVGLVVDDEHAQPVEVVPRARVLCPVGRRVLGPGLLRQLGVDDGDGQDHDEGRALALAGALHAHRAAVHLDEVLDDGQAEPESPAAPCRRAVGRAEPVEDVGQEVGPDADARVDDNLDSARSLSRLIGAAGHDTRTVHDGVQAVEQAAAYHPDVILLDVGLPGMNGYDVCRAIRRQVGGGEILIIAVTGWGQEDDRRKSKDAGFDAHLVKPIDFAELTRLLLGERPLNHIEKAVRARATTSRAGAPADDGRTAQ